MNEELCAKTQTAMEVRLVRKAEVARANSVSKRLVDAWLAKGCPHVKPSARLTLFNLDEVADWLRTTYGVRRLGPAKSIEPGETL